jgi:hypothetical protein
MSSKFAARLVRDEPAEVISHNPGGFFRSKALYSTRHRKSKESNGLTGSFEDRSWARKAII